MPSLSGYLNPVCGCSEPSRTLHFYEDSVLEVRSDMEQGDAENRWGARIPRILGKYQGGLGCELQDKPGNRALQLHMVQL